jgi:hypothetical protein
MMTMSRLRGPDHRAHLDRHRLGLIRPAYCRRSAMTAARKFTIRRRTIDFRRGSDGRAADVPAGPIAGQ